MRNKKSVIFMGTPDFAVPSLEKIHKEYHVLSVYTPVSYTHLTLPTKA